ncbi:hypothetical protein MycrhN_1012 [Mycolicibacterium rhodesiae NBB3]|jgi:hypothetical protein|uniref:Uncharacterized protein n=1 Tax=Mycolicibacterium rhodesiae (strain NBB3) TaxID=710685 RepID=G8RTY5_MYCRN|nr:hypothetical protein [Mycolicibacterium rhodesiae]AEV71638.1 hypothetical protein MycrhN_1012 [Mycolicibacterium rhodesiae NBB3]
MHRLTVRSAFAAIAIAAAALGSTTIASAAPTGPCQEVTYVGVCERIGGSQQQQRSPRQQGMGEVTVPGVGNNPVAIG